MFKRKVDHREIHGPEDCPYARLFGCHPSNCRMITDYEIPCPLAPVEVDFTDLNKEN